VAFSGPESKRHGAVCPDTGAPDDGFVRDGCAGREGDRQRWEIDASVGCVAWFDGSGIAFNELRLSVDMQIVDRQSAAPREVFTDAGNVFACFGVIDVQPRRR
jgi:hypothetical protein